MTALLAALLSAVGCGTPTPDRKNRSGPRPTDSVEASPETDEYGKPIRKKKRAAKGETAVPRQEKEVIALLQEGYERCLSVAQQYSSILGDDGLSEDGRTNEVLSYQRAAELELTAALTALQYVEGIWAAVRANASPGLYQGVETMKAEARRLCRSVQGIPSGSTLETELYREVNFRAAETTVNHEIEISPEERRQILADHELAAVEVVVDRKEYARQQQEWQEHIARQERLEQEKRRRLEEQQAEVDRRRREELEAARRRAEEARIPTVDPALQKSMETWHHVYSASVLPLKKALKRYTQVQHAAPKQKERACRELWQASRDLLGRSEIFRTPVPAVGESLRSAFASFQKTGAACVQGQGGEAEADFQKGARALGQAAKSLATYGLAP